MTAIFDEDDWNAEYERKMTAARAALDPRWGVKGYKGHNTSDGYAFVFTLTDNGKPVAWVEDAGQGGGPWASFQNRRSPAALAWDAEVARLFPDDGMGGESLIECLLLNKGK